MADMRSFPRVWARLRYSSATSSAVPCSRTRPSCMRTTCLHMDFTDPMSWETNSVVFPRSWNSFRRLMHLPLKCSSPTESASSMMRISGSTVVATENPSRTCMPEL